MFCRNILLYYKLQILHTMLNNGPFLFQTGHTALQRAAAEGHVSTIKTLLENGVSVDHQDEVVR